MSLLEYLGGAERIKKYEVYTEPELEFVAKFLNTYRSTYVIVLFLACEVNYEGRARASLSYGDRLLITKPDGTLLIHENRKREPTIWNPPGSTLYATVDNNILVIKSIRRNPPETVVVESPCVYLLLGARCVAGEFKLWGSEKDMVEYVFRNPSLIEEGFRPLHRELKTLVGEIDLVGVDARGNLVVLEFKRSTAGPEAAHQLQRYVEYIKHERGVENVRGILVAPSITPSAYRLLTKYGLEYRKLEPPRH